MSEQLELMVVDAQNAVQIFTGGGLDAVLDGIEAKEPREFEVIATMAVDVDIDSITDALLTGAIRNVKVVF